MLISKIISFYKKKFISNYILDYSKNRETAAIILNKIFMRNLVLQFQGDYNNLINKGITSFHFSVERWDDPLKLKNSTLDEQKKLRIGWDLILDIDGPYEYSKICTKLLTEALEIHGIKNPGLKYSGNKGFHIIIPWESIPKEINGEKTINLFPEIPKIVAIYLQEFIKEELVKEILKLENYNINKILNKTNKQKKEIISNNKINPFSFIEIDTIAMSSRHLIRGPYSFNEKTWLVSIPLNIDELNKFKRDDAKFNKIENTVPFIKKSKSAKNLIIQALDWFKKEEKKEEKFNYNDYKKISNIDIFPPCIKNILKGLEDGRKRSLFILINFLKSLKWEFKDIENFIYSWNQKNNPPLKEGYVKSQLNWHKNKKTILPPNCNNTGYYKDIGVCNPNNLCSKIKNPITYVLKMYKINKNNKK